MQIIADFRLTRNASDNTRRGNGPRPTDYWTDFQNCVGLFGGRLGVLPHRQECPGWEPLVKQSVGRLAGAFARLAANAGDEKAVALLERECGHRIPQKVIETAWQQEARFQGMKQTGTSEGNAPVLWVVLLLRQRGIGTKEKDMPFPLVDKVEYRTNPLESVVCQVRFPPLLRIDTEVPAGFQDKVRSQYDNVVEKQELAFQFQLGIPAGVQKDELGQFASPAVKNHEFVSDGSPWKLNLTRNFLALTTTEYRGWTEFRDRFQFALDALVEVYQPILFTRIGLRYTDVIVRSKLGLDGANWSDLIEEHVLGILGSSVRDNVEHAEAAFEVALKGCEGHVRVITRTVKSVESGEGCFMIDSDFYSTIKAKVEESVPRLNSFHAVAFRLFRWCITEKLNNALQ